jgi:hypothetical protein
MYSKPFLKMSFPKILLWQFYCLSMLFLSISPLKANDLHIGAMMVDISPKLPVALMGQFELRIAKTADTPLYAGIVVMESKRGTQALDTAIFVSCDLVYIASELRDELRAEVKRLLPSFNVNKIVLSATHTHTAPVLEDDPEKSSFIYPIPKVGMEPVKAYRDLFTKRVAEAIVKTWKARKPGSVTWGLNRTAVAYNRRAHYKDGSTAMYGQTNRSDFQNLEGYEDHDIHSMYFWDSTNKLIAMSIDVACPAQEFENKSTVNADYWHPVRENLKKKFGAGLTVLGWIGAAGDQSPHIMYRKAADVRMQKLANQTRMDDITARIVQSVTETYALVQSDQHKQLAFSHKTEVLKLPMRIITQAEYDESKLVTEDCARQIAEDSSKAPNLYAKMTWFGDVLKRYKRQQQNPGEVYESEIHVIRIGDAVVCTNQFELFTDYGIRIQARSKALQTFIIQLAGPGTYLPTAKAISGGGYSAVCQSNIVGAEGGQILVDRTVSLIDSLWQ